MDKNPLEKHLPKKPNLSEMTLREKVEYWWSRLRLRTLYYTRRMMPPMTKERVSEVQRQLRDSSTPTFDYFVMVLLSCMIATFGLLIDSAATIIGAMLVAPLMSPILGIGLASIRGDTDLLKNAVSALLRGAVLAVLLSMLITWLNGMLPFVAMQDLPAEVLSRTRPTPIDLGVALAGGLAATFALVQPNLSAALPGVAIATALMPPLCVIGIGVASGDWEVAQGSLLLFLTNSVTIAASSTFLFWITGFSLGRKDGDGPIPRSLQISAVLIIILLAPLGWQSYRFVQEASLTREIETVTKEEVANIGGELDSLSWQRRTDADSGQEILVMEITVMVSQSLDYENSVELQNAIAGRLQRTVQLKINQVYVAQLDPLIPPTNTPTLPVLPTATATFTPTITPTITPTPTATTTPTATPTVTYTPTPQTGMIRSSQYRLDILAFPEGPAIGSIYRNQPFLLLYDTQIVNGWVWVQIEDQDGRVGWVPQHEILQVTSTPVP